MKKPRYTEQQIAQALRQAERATSAAEIYRRLGASEATFYAWKKRYARMGVAELRRVRQLEDEHRRLKQVVAGLMLDKQMLQEVLQKRFEARPAARGARQLLEAFRVSARQACSLGQCVRGTFHCRARRRDVTALRTRLRELAAARPRFGYRRLCIPLRRERWPVNHKRVYRLYGEEQLAVRMR